MNDLSKYVELYRQTTEHDTEVLWSKVNIIRTAIADGADVETLLTECGKESGDSAKQVRKFYTVAKVFKDIDPAKDLDYWTHEVAATAPNVNPDDPATYEIAYEWVATAIRGYDSKQGRKVIRRKHSAATLKKAIRAATASGKPKAETVYKGSAVISEVGYAGLLLSIPMANPSFFELSQHEGTTVQITITRQPQPASEPQAAETAIEGSAA